MDILELLNYVDELSKEQFEIMQSICVTGDISEFCTRNGIQNQIEQWHREYDSQDSITAGIIFYMIMCDNKLSIEKCIIYK